MAKVTFDELLKKKLSMDERREERREIEVFDGKTMVFRRPSEKRIFEIVDEFESVGKSTVEAQNLIARLIYECCEDLHSAELQKSLDIAVPYDIVPALFSAAERVAISEKLIDFLEINEERIKN